MANSFPFHRRQFLRGVGACLALPALEAFSPPARAAAAAAESTAFGTALATTASGMPLRTAYLTVPDGVNLKEWRPAGTGSDYQLGNTFAPLANIKDKFQVFTGFEHKNATALGDGGGDHARATATFLTGAHPFKTAGSDIRNGISIDQVAAQQMGHLTRINSLQLCSEKARVTGQCDSGYSCAYVYNLSWASPTLPLPPESNPRAVFENIFGAGKKSERQKNLRVRQARRQSILDLVSEETRTIHRRVGSNDRHKLNEYLDSVRTIEKQIEQAERFPLPIAQMEPPTEHPGSHQEHIRLMFDLLAISFQTDSTRLATFPLAHEGSNRRFAELDINEGHHELSHHKGNEENLAKIAKIDHFYIQQLAYFLEKLQSMQDADGTSVLHNSMIVYGCCISDGNRHNHDDLPIILAGSGGGTLTPGRHVDLKSDVPMTNLFLSMLDRQGISLDRFADSTGRVADL